MSGADGGPAPLPLRDRIDACVAHVRSRWRAVPVAGLVLGTGLGDVADAVVTEAAFPYAELPHFPRTTVPSHAGRLRCGTLAGRPVVVLEGRFHRYEGHSLAEATFPVRVLRALGAGALITASAAGGLHPLWSAGDLLLVADHINLLGDNPLIGPHDASLGPRFPDMSEPYDPDLRAVARAVAARQGVPLREGTYVAVPGPSLETPAELRFLRATGADAVGMSTVPEVLVARHGGMRVLAVGVLTNQCLPDAPSPATLDGIVAQARAAAPALTAVVRGVVEAL